MQLWRDYGVPVCGEFEFMRIDRANRPLLAAWISSATRFVERLIGTVRRELLDQVPFWGALDLERKLLQFLDYYNDHRVHASLDGSTPTCRTVGATRGVIDLDDYQWQSHCPYISSRLPLDWQFATDREFAGSGITTYVIRGRAIY